MTVDLKKEYIDAVVPERRAEAGAAGRASIMGQPGVKIDYLTGDSVADGTVESTSGETTSAEKEETKTYVLNVSNGKFHLPDCDSVKKMKEENKQIMKCKRSELINAGYSPCGSCKP